MHNADIISSQRAEKRRFSWAALFMISRSELESWAVGHGSNNPFWGRWWWERPQNFWWGKNKCGGLQKIWKEEAIVSENTDVRQRRHTFEKIPANFSSYFHFSCLSTTNNQWAWVPALLPLSALFCLTTSLNLLPALPFIVDFCCYRRLNPTHAIVCFPLCHSQLQICCSSQTMTPAHE